MKRYWMTAIVLFSPFIALPEAIAQSDRLEIARQHMVRGAAAVEIAKTSDDLAAAVKELRMATQLAPELAPAWFNLAALEERLGHYAEAIEAYRRYLNLNPQADDAAKIGNEIIKLEYWLERSQAKARFTGVWIAQAGSASAVETYQIGFAGEKLVMTPTSRSWLAREISIVDDKRAPDNKNSFKAGGAQLAFEGRVVGQRIVGERIQPKTAISFDEEEPICGLRELRTPFEGALDDDGTTLTLSFNEPRYRISWGYIGSFLALGTSKSCRAVEELAAESVVLRLTRQQPPTERQIGSVGQAKNARDYLIRGGIALEGAKSDDDLILAEAEFRKATELDPLFAEAWYNLALLNAKMKRYGRGDAYRWWPMTVTWGRGRSCIRT